MSIKSVAVFCGSKAGNNPLFAKHAKQLGYLIAEKNITLIYGGGNKGIMGEIANAVLKKNGKVIGIIPKVLTEWEHQHHGLSELHEVADMHTRKRMLYEKCDAAIILPGGYGTMDELFEILTWNQLSIHDKKIILINSGGFYNHLILHLKTMEAEDFLYHKLVDKLIIVSVPEDVVFD
ncbi:MAG: TIGR00730 family Rossman fold protein [Ginsengibacter sp.]